MTQIFIFKVSVIFSANLVHLNIHIYLHNKYSKIHADTSHMTTTVLVSVGTFIIIMALVLYARRILRREITFRDRQNPLDYMPDEDLLQKYRLPRNNIIKLCKVVHVSLQHRTRRNHALQVSLQILVVLRYYAVGGFHDPLGQGHGIHKSTISRCIARVSAAIICNQII